MSDDDKCYTRGQAFYYSVLWFLLGFNLWWVVEELA